MERTLIKNAFNSKDEILLKGWVHETRDLKKVRFLILKDITEFSQTKISSAVMVQRSYIDSVNYYVSGIGMVQKSELVEHS